MFLIIFTIILIISVFIYFLYLVLSKNKLKNNDDKKLKGIFPDNLISYNFNKKPKLKFNHLILPVLSSYSNKKKFLFTPKKGINGNFGHCAIIGPSGTGKTLRIFEPMIYWNAVSELKPSMIITDLKPDEGKTNSIYLRYKEFLKQQGYKIWNLNLEPNLYPLNLKANEENFIPSNSYNPMEIIYQNRNNDFLLGDAIEKFLSFIIDENEDKKDPFWDLSAKTIIETFVYFMLENNYSLEEFNFENLVHLLTIDFIKVIALIENNPTWKSYQSYSLFMNKSKYDDRAYENIKKTIATKIKFMNDKLIRVISTQTNIFPELMRKEPIVLFIQIRSNNDYYLRFATLAISQITEKLELNSKGKDILVLADEFNSLPKIEKLAEKLERNRSVNIWWFLGMQSLERIEVKYGYLTAFLENFFQIIILQSLSTKQIDLLIGGYEKEVERETFTTSNEGRRASSRSLKTENVVFTREIKNLRGKYAYIRSRGYDPYKSVIDYGVNFLEIKKIIEQANEQQELKPYFSPKLKVNTYLPEKVVSSKRLVSNEKVFASLAVKNSILRKKVAKSFKKFTKPEERARLNDLRERTDGPHKYEYWKVVSEHLQKLKDTLDAKLIEQMYREIYYVAPTEFKNLFDLTKLDLSK